MRTNVIFSLLILVVIAGGWAASQLKFETDITAYNLAANTDIESYEAFVNKLNPGDWKETIIVIEKPSAWRTPEDFLLLDALLETFEAYSEVENVSGITNLRYPKKGLLLPGSVPFLDLRHKQRLQKRLDDLEQYADIVDKFLSKNKVYSLLFMSIPEGINAALAVRMQASVESVGGLKVHFVQYELIQKALDQTVKKDTLILTVISLFLVLLGFYMFTFSLRGLLLIVLVVGFNIGLLLLLMYTFSVPFTMHMITIPCIITVLSFTDIMHILYHQNREYAAATSDKRLQQNILAEVGTPLLLTSLTNSIGFIVFMVFAENTHLFHFSLFAFLGVVIAYASARFLVIPLMTTQSIFIKRNQFRLLHQLHDKVTTWFERWRRYILPVFIGSTLLLLLGVGRQFRIDSLEQTYTLSSSSLTTGQTILQQEFFGSKRAEVLVRLQAANIWDKQTLNQMEAVEAYIETHFDPYYINSPLTVVRRYHRYLSNGEPAAFFIPHKLNDTYKKQLTRFQNKLGGAGIIDTGAINVRMVFGFDQWPLEEARLAYAGLKNVLAAQSDDNIQFELSGLQYLSDEATHQFSVKVLLGLLVSILFGSVQVLILLKSWRKSMGVFFVNIFPLLFALALLLAWGVAISPMTLFLLSVLLGICVDDSIYLIMQHDSNRKEIHLVPVFITSWVLSMGFLSLIWAHFEWLKPFGYLFLMGISLAYILDFFVLPLFLKNHHEK